MIRKVALCASLSILASCATPSIRPAEPAKPPAVDPRICAPVQQPPAKPAGATIVQPVSAAEIAATDLFLNWVAGLIDLARENARRATLAQAACR